jgi:hypothetical protein
LDLINQKIATKNSEFGKNCHLILNLINQIFPQLKLNYFSILGHSFILNICRKLRLGPEAQTGLAHLAHKVISGNLKTENQKKNNKHLKRIARPMAQGPHQP